MTLHSPFQTHQHHDSIGPESLTAYYQPQPAAKFKGIKRRFGIDNEDSLGNLASTDTTRNGPNVPRTPMSALAPVKHQSGLTTPVPSPCGSGPASPVTLPPLRAIQFMDDSSNIGSVELPPLVSNSVLESNDCQSASDHTHSPPRETQIPHGSPNDHNEQHPLRACKTTPTTQQSSSSPSFMLPRPLSTYRGPPPPPPAPAPPQPAQPPVQTQAPTTSPAQIPAPSVSNQFTPEVLKSISNGHMRNGLGIYHADQGAEAQLKYGTVHSVPNMRAYNLEQQQAYLTAPGEQKSCRLTPVLSMPYLGPLVVEQPVGSALNEGSQLTLAATKDIKRRTKTGCLTCRKRRIKKTCNNCDKSKRVCLAYDPVFEVTSDRRKYRKKNSSATKHSDDDFQPEINGKTDVTLYANGKYPRGEKEPRNVQSKMCINSLLDAAAVLTEKNGGDRGIETAIVRYDSWKQLSSNYFFSIAPVLNLLFGTTRFSSFTVEDDKLTVQSAAVIEAIRQITSSLYPQLDLRSLAVDETKVSRMEELKVSNEYKLLRCIAQLISPRASESTEFLSVSESDSEIFSKVLVIHRLIHGSVWYEQVSGDPMMTFRSSLLSKESLELIEQHPSNEQYWQLIGALLSIGEERLESVQLNDWQLEKLLRLAQVSNDDLPITIFLISLQFMLANSPVASKIRMRLLGILESSSTDILSKHLLRTVLSRE